MHSFVSIEPQVSWRMSKLNKNLTITTISEYLDCIRKNDLTEFIFRGQNEAYNGIRASGFRPYQGGWDSDRFYNIDGMKKEYFNKVVSKLTTDERSHFIAFCQHHGLPTNLVDFTFSPLVALFFACSGKSVSNEMKSAEIYLISKKKLIKFQSKS
jgi:FRG domain.